MDLQPSFLTLSNEVRRYQIMNPKESSSILSSLQKFTKILQKTDTELISIFLSVHYEEIIRVARDLRSMIEPPIRSLYDKVFTNCLNIQKRIPSPLTVIFQDFIKGITYFQHQAGIEIPIYHRLYACGPGDFAFRETYQRCGDTMEEYQIEDVKRRIETCFLERLIYDKLYCDFTLHFPNIGTELPSQDEGHCHRLQMTKEDFSTCFPHLSIAIDIVWHLQLPTQLVVRRFFHGKLTSTETYTKTIIFHETLGHKTYDPFVECFRETEHKNYYRTQRYDFLPKWKEI